MKIRVKIDGSPRYRGTVYRHRSGQVVDLPDDLARAYLAAGGAEEVASDAPPERKVVAPEADTSDHPDETPDDGPDETPEESSDEDKATHVGGGWYEYPDGTKRRGRP